MNSNVCDFVAFDDNCHTFQNIWFFTAECWVEMNHTASVDVDGPHMPQ